MTVVLAVVKEEFSILMTDTRISFEKGAESPFNDSALKLQSLNYPNGWFAGTGFSTFLGNLHDLVTGCFFTTSQQYVDSFVQVSSLLIKNNPATIQDIRATTCYRSYLNNGELEIDFFRVQANDIPEVLNLLKNRIAIGFPSHFTQIEEIVRKYDIHSDQTGDFPEILLRMLNIFKEISSNSSAVSDICEIGILKKNGIIKKYSISGRVDDLLNEKSIELL